MIKQVTNLKDLKEKKEKLEVRLGILLLEIKELVKNNLISLGDGLSDYKKGCKEIKWGNGMPYLIALHRLERFYDLCKEQAYLSLNESVYSQKKINCMIDGNLQTYEENTINVKDYFKRMYCYYKLKYLMSEKLNLKIKDPIEFEDGCKISIYLNIVTGIIVFYKAECVLSTLNAEKIQWIYPPHLEEIFNKNLKFDICVVEMKFFIFKKKLDFLIKKIINMFDLPNRKFELLTSFLFVKMFGCGVLIDFSDILNDNFIKYAKEKLGSFFEKLYLQDFSDKKKALIITYLFILAPGVIEYANIDYFEGKTELYYVEWIKYYKNTTLN